ncbi:adenylate kinase 8-like [Strongylocentrotus purpuratus]|uniref:ATPase AAA-type core domain-containing protein n=1 Tax=Strongylocentrotus purpuratus TaxID=7668 RepID=A0A7M7PNZ0_STRPU|nr:adenylate kinase 8-like [Strongylocentrotus purpuratus]
MVLYLFSHFLFFFIYQRLIEGLIISKSQDPLDYLLEQLKRENDDTPAIVIHGPPASGKTTIARLVSNQLKAAYTNKGTLLADDVSTTAAKARSCQSSGELFWKPPDTVLIERQTGKRIDPETGGLVEPPEGCREEAMVDRLILFHRFIPGLKVAYEQYTKSINADQPKADVYSQVTTFLSSKTRSLAPHNPRIVLLGPTGSGKTVQAALPASKYGIIDG